MNTTIRSYLTFNGNCREAMLFYKDCLGGELAFQTVGATPFSEHMPQQMKDCILHASLTKGDLVLMGTDMVDRFGLIRGNAISLMLDCSSETELQDTFRKLAVDGHITHPITQNLWGSLTGDLTDKFGNQWLLHFQHRA